MSRIVGAKLVSDATSNEILIGSPFKRVIFERIRAQKVLQEILQTKDSPRRNSSPGKICTTISKLFPQAAQDPHLTIETPPIKLRVSSLTNNHNLAKTWRHFRIVKNKDTSHLRKNIEAVSGLNKPPKAPAAHQKTQRDPEPHQPPQAPRFELKLKRTLSVGDLTALVDAPLPEHVYTQQMTGLPDLIVPFGSGSVLGLTSPVVAPKLHKATRSVCGLEAIAEELPHCLGLERINDQLPKTQKARGGIGLPISRLLKVVPRAPIKPVLIAELDSKQIYSRPEQPTFADQRHRLLRETHRLAAL